MIHNKRLRACAFPVFMFIILISFSACPSYEALQTVDIICIGAEEGLGCIGLKVNSDKEPITVTISTADGSNITVEGCKKTAIKSGVETTLYSTDADKIILKGKITDSTIHGAITTAAIGGDTPRTISLKGCKSLWRFNCYTKKLSSVNVQNCINLKSVDCSRNKITELNIKGCRTLKRLNCAYNKLEELDIQDCIGLKELKCQGNQLNGAAFITICNNLPTQTKTEKSVCILYTEEVESFEGNVSDFSQPAALKHAFEAAKNKGWILKKQTETGETEL